ncbi:MAG TPA: hypothetical protein DCX32_00330 [Candidatus Moranbacteria bacterium]|nr:MAG: hypothetical protein UW87_C0005G0011 [Candidatus Moranbacteria bacterium GW2011_GWC2_45_10]KKT95293.1 MAG: hypothetical protein UW95_C0002G0036 [Parcubacteria group bacterium GW2011_GWC1_45_14]HAV10984.1 hypothetical protein [Candidatus Moranbacteria bacterium]
MKNYDREELIRRLAEKVAVGEASREDVEDSGLKLKSGRSFNDVLKCGILKPQQEPGGNRLMVHHTMNNLREIVE